MTTPSPEERSAGPRLVRFQPRHETEQEQALQPFLDILPAVENFVIFVHTKDGSLSMVPCLDPDLPIWDFVAAFRHAAAEQTRDRLATPTDVGRAG
jgi:hypothetical protein